MLHLCDSNVFLALVVEQHAQHAIARQWFESLGDGDLIAFCRGTQTTFLRLLTRRIAEDFIPLNNNEAWDIYTRLHDTDSVTFVDEPADVESKWQELSARDTPSPKVWMDAYLAAFAISGGFRFVSFDQDFERYMERGLNLLRPGP